MTAALPKVFISYSHDSVVHQARVLRLSDRLRADGVNAEIDQYNTAPTEGWPLWCERQIEVVDFVLMVCTEIYHCRVKGDEQPGTGLGAIWEASIIRQLLYDVGAHSDKFIPVLFSDGLVEYVPTLIRGRTRYVVDTEDGYEGLLRQLSGQPSTVRPILGHMRPLPARRRQWPAGEPSAAREPRTLLVPRQLPSDLADFTGREAEIAALERALGGAGGGVAISAIGGMGGVGKTALAVHVAHRLVARYPDGQIVINLKGTTEPLSPPAAMGRVILALDPAWKLPDDAAELAGLYRSLLGGKRLLILFDNAADAAQVRELLPAPPCATIVTSRHKVVLPGLRRVPLDVLAPAEADALLLRIIAEGRAAAQERTLLAERCGHLPLALRVAGTFLAGYADWGAAEYLVALADERERLRRLCIEGDALLDVAAALGLSLRQLARERPELVERWRMLAVFAGGFDREAAAAVWAVAPAEARDGLSPLLERSVLLFDDAKKRYRLHDLMRDLALGAAEPLNGEEERRLEEARDRHSAHYQGLLATANTLFWQGGDGVAAGLARFDQERANIEAGWCWLLGQAANDEAMARRRSAYVDAGFAVLPLRQHPRVQIEWLERALAAARHLGDRRAEGAALGNIGIAYTKLSEARRAIEYYEQALVIAREIGDRQYESSSFSNMGLAYASLGEYRRAIECYEQALVIAREIGERRGESAALCNMGLAYTKLREPRRAIECYEQALVIARETGNHQGEGAILGNMGIAYRYLDEPRRAIEYHEQSLAIAREIGNHQGEGTTLGDLGLAYASLGEYRRAIEYHEQHLAIARETGDRQGEGNAVFNVALSLDAVGERAEAVARMREAAEIFDAIESPAVEQARARLREWTSAGAA